jgi:hypothetical protein
MPEKSFFDKTPSKAMSFDPWLSSRSIQPSPLASRKHYQSSLQSFTRKYLYPVRSRMFVNSLTDPSIVA